MPKLPANLLVAICGYRGGIGNPPPYSFVYSIPWAGPLAPLLDRVTFLNFRRFVATNRDFFANVRSVEYQAKLLEEALKSARSAAAEIRIDRSLANPNVLSRLQPLGHVEVVDSENLLAGAKNFGGVLLVYPDALGLGWSRAEKCLPKDNVYIVNGRRRLFPLDEATRRGLGLRRFLAKTRLPEIIAGILVVPLAASCALRDGLREKA